MIEKKKITYRRRCIIILVNACTNGDPEHNENASKADQGKGNATRFYADLQHSRYEGVDSEKLVGCILARFHMQGH